MQTTAQPRLDLFDSIADAVNALAAGQFVLVLDNEDRENEGDLIISGDKVWRFCVTFRMSWLCPDPSVLLQSSSALSSVNQPRRSGSIWLLAGDPAGYGVHG